MEEIENQSDCSHVVEQGFTEQGHSISLDSAFLLRDAIRDLNRIALVDNDNYNEMLLSPSSAKCSETDGLIEAQEKLAATEEAMLHDPEQVETGHALGGLARAIYGFHSYVHALKDSSDKHADEHRRQADEILKLQRQVEKLQTQNSKLRKYIRKIVNENDNLTDELNQASRDKRKLFRHAKNLTAEIHSSKKHQEELQVLAHEQLLIMASCSRERKGTAETEASTLFNDDGTPYTQDVHSDFSLISPFHDPPTPRVLMIPANETPPLFLQDALTANDHQPSNLSESPYSDMSPSPILANFLEQDVALKTNSQDELLNDAGCEVENGCENSMADLSCIENLSETSKRHPKSLLQSLRLRRRLLANSDMSMNSLIFKEKSIVNKTTTNTSDGCVVTVSVCTPSSSRIEEPEKMTSQDEQIDESMHPNKLGNAEMHEAAPALGSERGGYKPKATFPFWKRGQHNFA